MQIRSSLRNMLTVFVAITTLFAIVIIGVMGITYVNKSDEGRQMSIDLFMNEQKKSMKNELSAIRTVLYSLANKDEIKEYAYETQPYRVKRYSYVDSLLSDALSYVTYIDDIVFKASENHIISTAKQGSIESYITRNRIAMNGFATKDKGYIDIYRTIADESAYVLAVYAPIVKNNSEIGSIIGFCSEESLLKYWNDTGINYSISDNYGNTIYSNVENDIIGISFTIDELGWVVTMEPPIKEFTTEIIQEILMWTLKMLAVFIILECTAMFCIYRSIIKPITSICEQSKLVYNSYIYNPVPQLSELNTLTDSINAMILRISQLTNEVNEAKIRSLREKNMFLQSQINPHLLYNTLECICGMSSNIGAENIRIITQSLSTLYRYCLKSPMSTLGEEIKSLEYYGKVIDLYYDKKHNIINNIPSTMYDLPIVRMLLEPIVENAIQHGFNHGDDNEKNVFVNAIHKDGMLMITVEDNGYGMSDQKIAQINEMCENDDNEMGQHIGLGNVAKRVRFAYGGNSGLTVGRNEFGGVTVTVVIDYNEKQ